MEQRTKATIDDVARRAQVSISTVSRVLNGRDRVHPQTRQRIQQAIAELGYRPSALARGLALQQTSTIGLIVPNITDPFFLEIVRGVEETAGAAGYSMLIASQSRDTAEHRYHHLFTHGRVDGLILVAIDIRHQDLDQFFNEGFPVAVIQEDLGTHVPTFLAANYAGARALTEHLIGHGYRRIAFITGSDYTPDSGDRLRALREVLSEHGLTLAEDDILKGDFMYGSGYTAMNQLLERDTHPEAVFAANDQMAIAAIQAATGHGLRVPDDIAIVGFDDISLASYTVPRLTTVRQPVYQLGCLAAEAVLGADSTALAPQRIVLPTELVIRESCGCAAPRANRR